MDTKEQEIILPTITLGQVLTRIRAQEVNKNQEEFAFFLGIDISSLSRWERNITIPNRANMLRVKKKLEPWLTSIELSVFENQNFKPIPEAK